MAQIETEHCALNSDSDPEIGHQHHGENCGPREKNWTFIGCISSTNEQRDGAKFTEMERKFPRIIYEVERDAYCIVDFPVRHAVVTLQTCPRDSDRPIQFALFKDRCHSFAKKKISLVTLG